MNDTKVGRARTALRLCTACLLITALFLCAGVGLRGGKTIARAVDGGIKGSDYFTTNATGVLDSADGVQLYTDKDKTWQAKFNGVFTGDFSMDFDFAAWPINGNDFYSPTGQLTVRVADAADETNYFDVIYARMLGDSTPADAGNSGYTDARVEYGEQVRSSNDNGVPVNGRAGWNMVLPALQDKAWDTAPLYPRTGKLALKWDGDILSVQVTAYDVNNNHPLKTIAAFDGTESFSDGWSEDAVQWQNVKWKLPKLDFLHGYTVTLISEKWESSWSTQWANDLEYYPKNARVEIQSINGRDMGTNGTGTISRFSAAPTFTVAEETRNAAVGQAFTLPAASVTVMNEAQTAVETGVAPWKVTIKVDAAESTAYANETEITVSAPFTPDAAGTYTVTYYGTQSLGDAVSNKKTLTVTAYDTAATALVGGNAPDNVTVAASIVNSTVKSELGAKGLGLTFNESGTVKLNAVFTGDFDLRFQIDSLAHKGVRQFDTLTFRFTPIAGGKHVDVVVYTGGVITWQDWYSFMYVAYGEQKYTTIKYGETVYGTDEIESEETDKTDDPSKPDMYENAGLCDALLTYHESRTASPDHLGVVKFDTSTLSFQTAYNSDEKYTLASFNDKKYAWENNTVAADFARGYTVEIIGVTTQEDATLTLHELNGISLGGAALPVALAEESKILKGAASVSFERTNAPYVDGGIYSVTAATDKGFALLTGETATGYTVTDGEGITVSDFRLNRSVGSYTVTYAAGVTRTVVLTEDETPPSVTWAGEAPAAIAYNTVAVSKDDVTAVDALDGAIASANITVRIQEGNGDPTDYTDGYTFETGAYTIIYEAKDAANNAGSYRREVYVVHSNDVTWNVETVASTAVVGKSVTLPAATVTVQEQTKQAVVSVIFDGQAIVENVSATAATAFTATAAGAYTVIYRAVDVDGDPVIKTFTVTAALDVQKPTITVAKIQASCGTGLTCSLPVATASDPEDGNVAVTVKVYFGTQEVAITDGKFVTANEGTYTIVYTAVDAAGNETTETFILAAVEGGAAWGDIEGGDADDPNKPVDPDAPAKPVDPGETKGCGCGGSIATAGWSLCALSILGAAAVVLLRRKKSTGN